MTDRNVVLNEPTPGRWREELQVVLAGARDAEVRILGSVEEYVERQLRDSTNRDDAEGAFAVALNDEVTAWQVGRRTSEYYVAGILQLVCAFTPTAGFAKAIEVVEHAISQQQSAQHWSNDDVPLIALTALSRFYRTPPPNATRDKAYRKYVDLLHATLLAGELGELGAVALRQLLELGEAEPSTEVVANAITSYGTMLDAAVDFAVLPPAPWNEEHLSAVLSVCVASQDIAVLDRFISRIEWHDAPAYMDDECIVIAPHDSLKLYVHPEPALSECYAGLRWQKYSVIGLEKWMSMEVDK